MSDDKRDNGEGEVEIVSEETIESKLAKHNLWTSKLAVILALSIVGLYALIGAVVLAVAFYQGKDPPTWATAVESSAITAALAVIFKDRLPDRKR